ncbi:hypothetical protein A2U01_0096655, partial [Trifolium medium]|nr:hypothetical protein [Trifolium medium]
QAAQRAVLSCVGRFDFRVLAQRAGWCCATRSVLVSGLTFVDF